MSYVSQRSSSANPNFTTPGMKYYYQFIQVPTTPWRASAPASTVTIDGDIMPKRDVNDAANGTDTWKILRGVDMYFAYEGAYERWTAANQFNTSSWPRSTWYDNITRPYILSYPWQWAQGNDPQYSKTGLANCYQGMWLKNITSSSDLSAKYTSDGSNKLNTGRPQYNWFYYLDYAIGKWELSDMVSHYDDFASGSPLSADAVRRVYYDMGRLKWYTPWAGIGYGGPTDPTLRTVNINATQFSQNSWSHFEDWTPYPPDPTTNRHLLQLQQRTVQNYGESNQRGGYWGYTATAGTYLFPRPGYGTYSGVEGVTPFMGDLVACYAALHLHQQGDDISARDIYEWRKVDNATLTDTRWVSIPVNKMTDAAYQMMNEYNATVPREMGAADRYTTVECEYINIVCQLTDRTDISQIGWNWNP